MKALRPLPRQTLKKSEAAAILRVSDPTLDKIIASKKLRVFHPTPGCTRILPADLEDFIVAHANIPAKPTLVPL
jgi:hypothetical protein